MYHMNINIYYGGRGLIDDPAIFVMNKIITVLDEFMDESISKEEKETDK